MNGSSQSSIEPQKKSMTTKNPEPIKGHQHIGAPFYASCLTGIGIIGFLSIKGCTNTSLFILLIISVSHLFKNWQQLAQNKIIFEMKPIIFAMASPLLAILISQSLRQDFYIKSYDAPSRIFLSIPILIYFYNVRIKFDSLLTFSAPLALLTLMPILHSNPEVLNKWGGRFATSAVDPTAFGTYTMILTVLCLFSVRTDNIKSNSILLALQITGLVSGLYLVLGSGTRGSWIGLPPLIVLWAILERKNPSKKTLYYILALILTTSSLIFLAKPNTIERIFSGFHEPIYWLNKSNTETSTGLRLTMWQISWELFKINPLQGYGDHSFKQLLNEPGIASNASLEARETILYNGPHNELLANLLRSGIFGGISVLALFIVPLSIFWKNKAHRELKHTCHLGLAYIISLIICSFSSEVLTLKYTSSFYGLVIAGLMSQVYCTKQKNNRDELN